MFNLIVGFGADTSMSSDRMLGYTEPEVRAYLSPNELIDAKKLEALPVLVMPESGDSESEQVARVGSVEVLRAPSTTSKFWRYHFVENIAIPPIPTDKIVDAAGSLAIDRWEFTRTHWAVKEVDLYRVIHELDLVRANCWGSAQPEQALAPEPAEGTVQIYPAGFEVNPTVFRLPLQLPRDPTLVAVMMPFSGDLAQAYVALQEAASDAGLRCVRADEIWESQHIMDDIISLIWQARVVVADFTGKNANVFYEAGIAHTLGRDLIPIAQSMEDIPFDLRGIRARQYLNNSEGREPTIWRGCSSPNHPLDGLMSDSTHSSSTEGCMVELSCRPRRLLAR